MNLLKTDYNKSSGSNKRKELYCTDGFVPLLTIQCNSTLVITNSFNRVLVDAGVPLFLPLAQVLSSLIDVIVVVKELMIKF